MTRPTNRTDGRTEQIRYVLDSAGRRLYKCPRCGMVRGWFRDEDFRGLWHDWAALDAEVKTLRRDLARLTLAHTNTLDALTHVELAEGEVTA